MKKYLLGFFALVAVLVASAFTIRKDPKNSVNPTYYWYVIENNQVQGPRLNNVKVDKDEAMQSLTDCEDLTSTICLAGSDDPNLDFEDPVPSAQTDNYIFKTQ